MNIEFEIPKNWKILTLEDVAEGKNAIVDGPFGSNLKTSDYIDDKVNGVPVLTTKNLEGDYSDDKVRFISKEKFETLKRSQVNPGDILVAKIGSIGKTGIYPKNARTAIIPANLLKFTVSKNVNFDYIFYYLNSRGLQNKIKKIATATAQPAFNVTKFRKLRIPLPPLPEQHAIVAKIEELLSELDNGKQQLLTAQQQLKVYRQSLLKWAFEGKLTNKNVKDGELPKGWKWVRMGDACEKIQDGSHFSPQVQYDESGENRFKYITAKNIRNNYMDFRKVIYVDKDYHDSIYSRCNPEFGDVLLTKDGINTGEVTLNTLHEPFSLLSSVCLFKTKEIIISSYLKYFIQSPFGNKAILESMTGTAIKRIVLRKIKDAKVILPPLPEQQLIVSELESKLTVCDKIEETISQSLQQAESLRQSILKKAFEGKLVNYELEKVDYING